MNIRTKNQLMHDPEASNTQDMHTNPGKEICAIHQPNFFPWSGYFDKIRRADIFVFLDDVDYPKSGSGMGTWSNRVQLAIQGKAAWVGCALQGWSGRKPIREVRFNDAVPWRKKMLRTLEMNYRRAANYEQAIEVLEPLILFETELLSVFNMNAIRTICTMMGIKGNFLLQSEMNTEGASSQLLINLTKAAGATTYLSGGGASGYQDDDLFLGEGIQVVYQNFNPEPYGDSATFISGLSVIDYLMKAGGAFPISNR